MRTSVVASMGTTFTHRDEMRTVAPGARPAGQVAPSPARLGGRRRVTKLFKRS